MYLKNKWNDIGVKSKLFIISTSLVLITSIAIYTALFLIIPNVYLSIKQNNIKNSTEQIVSKLEKDTNTGYIDELNTFSYENGSMVIITTVYGDLVYVSNGFIGKPMMDEFNRKPFKELKREDEEISINKQFYFKAIGKECTITIHTPTKIFNDGKRIMIKILPIIILITICIGILSAYIYSAVISKPLLKINGVAKKISKLNFDEKLKFSGDDEIAELSSSINLISTNLQDTIGNLENVNKKLLSDIEKEKLQDKRRRDFIKAISHELKTPITVINGQLEGMIYNIGPYKDRDKYLRESLDSALELKDLVSEIINLAKYEEEVSLRKEIFNLNKLIEEVICSHKFLRNERGLKLKITEEADLNVFGDKNIIKKVLSNLINNSFKYALKDSEININIKKNGAIQIINKCNEISEVDKADLFKAFHRVEKSRNKETGGNGLGLYIVKTLLDMHEDIDYNISTELGYFIFNIKFKLK
ncbi:HAMP domain-containing sensor histidine kinase [Clostridium sp.]|uniref:HAMP domain-containing sensor histidine kinase n=1 Tax=Clostridium sp. TaxID=1506 RepID=UPI002FC622C2